MAEDAAERGGSRSVDESIQALQSALANRAKKPLTKSNAGLIKEELRSIQDGLGKLKSVLANRRARRSEGCSTRTGGLDESSYNIDSDYQQRLMTRIDKIYDALGQDSSPEAGRGTSPMQVRLACPAKAPIEVLEAALCVLESDLLREQITVLKLDAMLKVLLQSDEQRTTWLRAAEQAGAAPDISIVYKLEQSLNDSLRTLLAERNTQKRLDAELETALRAVKDLSALVAGNKDDAASPAVVEQQALKIQTLHQELKIARKDLAYLKELMLENKTFSVASADPAFLRTIIDAVRADSKAAGGSPSCRPTTSSTTASLLASTTGEFNSLSVVGTCTQEMPYKPVPGDEIDSRVGEIVNNECQNVKVLPTRLQTQGRYLFGTLPIRISLSSRSKTPLVFHDGKKHSLRKFMSVFQDAEFAKLQCIMDSKASAPLPISTAHSPAAVQALNAPPTRTSSALLPGCAPVHDQLSMKQPPRLSAPGLSRPVATRTALRRPCVSPQTITNAPLVPAVRAPPCAAGPQCHLPAAAYRCGTEPPAVQCTPPNLYVRNSQSPPMWQSAQTYQAPRRNSPQVQPDAYAPTNGMPRQGPFSYITPSPLWNNATPTPKSGWSSQSRTMLTAPQVHYGYPVSGAQLMGARTGTMEPLRAPLPRSPVQRAGCRPVGLFPKY